MSTVACAALLAACGSINVPTTQANSLNAGNDSTPTPTTGAAPCGNGNATDAVPTAWTLIPGSQGYSVRYFNTHGALVAGDSNDVDGAFHRSLDGGNTWVSYKHDGDNACIVNVLTSDNNVVYGNCAQPTPPPGYSIAEESTAAISFDAGDTWQNLTPAWLADVADPTNPNVAYGYESHKGDTGFGGTYVTRDAGATWQRMTSEPNGWVTAVGPTGNDLYVSERLNPQTAASHDGGVTWTRTAFQYDVQFAPATSSLVYAAARNVEVVASRDGGASWQTIYPHCALSVAVAPWNTDFVFAQTCMSPGSASGYVASTDGGQTWANVPTPVGCSLVNWIVFNADTRAVSAACSNGVYRAVTP